MTRYPGGTSVRHDIFRTVMAAITGVYGGGAFPGAPANLLNGSGIQMPSLAGSTQEQAKALVEGLGFRFALGSQVDSDLAAGLVTGANYSPGPLLARGMTVTVSVSLGNLIALPDVVGQERDAAIAALNGAGFTNVSTVCSQIAPTPPPGEPGEPGDPSTDGRVTAQSPGGGSKVKYETGISLTVARLVCP